jgi:hypothetical protein
MRSPIAIKIAAQETGGSLRFMYWMRARDIPAYEGPFQKVWSLPSLACLLLTRRHSAS